MWDNAVAGLLRVSSTGPGKEYVRGSYTVCCYYRKNGNSVRKLRCFHTFYLTELFLHRDVWSVHSLQVKQPLLSSNTRYLCSRGQKSKLSLTRSLFWTVLPEFYFQRFKDVLWCVVWDKEHYLFAAWKIETNRKPPWGESSASFPVPIIWSFKAVICISPLQHI